MSNDSSDIPQSSTTSVDLRQYALLFWHWAWLILLVGAIAGGTAYYINNKQTPLYRASTRLLISEPPNTVISSFDSNGIVSSTNMALTYSKMLTDMPVLQEVVDKLQIQVSPGYLQSAISVSQIQDTQLLQVSVVDINPQRAAAIANTLGDVFAARIQTLESARYTQSKDNLQKQITDMEAQLQSVSDQLAGTTDSQEIDRLQTQKTQYQQIYAALVTSFEQVRLAEAQSTVNVVQVEAAAVPWAPFSPRPMQNGMLAGAVGILLAIGVIFAIDLLDDTVRDPEQVSAQTGLPILGIIPHHEGKESLLITQTQPRSPVSEAYRSLRTNVEYANTDHNLHRILVTSPLPEDGKTTVITNLAVVMSQRGLRTTLLDGDLRRPRSHRILGLQNRSGLSSLFLQSEVNLNGHVQATMLKDLSLLSSGPLPPNPAELLGSRRMADVLDQLDKVNDIILIDTPPSLTVTDAAVLAPLVDGILVVVKAGVTKMNAVKRMVAGLRQVGARLIGIVVNDVSFTRSRYAHYYYSYYAHNYYYNSDKPHSRNGKGKVKKNPAPVPENSEEQK